MKCIKITHSRLLCCVQLHENKDKKRSLFGLRARVMWYKMLPTSRKCSFIHAAFHAPQRLNYHALGDWRGEEELNGWLTDSLSWRREVLVILRCTTRVYTAPLASHYKRFSVLLLSIILLWMFLSNQFFSRTFLCNQTLRPTLPPSSSDLLHCHTTIYVCTKITRVLYFS